MRSARGREADDDRGFVRSSGKTQWEIDTWSYRRGVEDGYIPSDVSNISTRAFPILPNGCVDSSFDYEAPKSTGGGGPWNAGSRVVADGWTVAVVIIAGGVVGLL